MTKKKQRRGHALTAKNLPPAAYAAIHNLPRGFKYKTLVALLEAAGALGKQNKNWFKGKLSVVSK